MLTIYEVVNGSTIRRERGEQECCPVWETTPPTLHQMISMGADVSWIVLETHAYQSADGELLHIAMVHRAELPTPERDLWYGVRSRMDYPTISFNIQFTPDRRFLQLGMNMDGRAPTRQLLNAVAVPGTSQVSTTPTEWWIEQTVAYWPIADATATYSTVHIGYCVARVNQLIASITPTL
ncbi:MAG: hypothetical protein RLZZ511_2409 [Cyanobacteriota bacterium]|jgi:hypothetical protein